MVNEDFFPLENLLSFRKPEDVLRFVNFNIDDRSLKWEKMKLTFRDWPFLDLVFNNDCIFFNLFD